MLTLVAITWLRISLIDHLPDQGFFAKYVEIAQEILAGQTPHDRLGDLSSGYLWSVVFWLGPMSLGVVALRTAQIIGVSLAAAFCGAASWRRWGIHAGLGTAAVLLSSRAALVNATEIEPETLILVLASIGLSLIVAFDHPLARTVAGLALGLAVVTRPSILLPAVLVVGALWWRPGTSRKSLAVLPLVLGIALPVFAMRMANTWVTADPPTPMNPGTVLFEGWNPLATGYLGEAPVVVKGVEQTLGLPDGLHVAYRLVASRATNLGLSAENSNAYWAQRAVAFVRNEPITALKLGLRKAFLGLHSYDAWDLKTLQRKSQSLEAMPFAPFGLLVALAALGILLGWRQPWAPILGMWVFGGWSVMVLFYVSARQRNVLLPAIALLAGIAIDMTTKAWRSGQRRRVIVSLIAVILVGVLLTIEGVSQSEDRHGWLVLQAQEAATHEAFLANQSTDSIEWLALAASFLDPSALRTTDPHVIESAVRTQLAETQSPQRYFDLALVMIEIERFPEAERLLESLDAQGYRPRRGGRWCSSIAYHLARCRLAASDHIRAQSLIKLALKQSPGDPRVLALDAVLSDLSETSEIESSSQHAMAMMFDPFTRSHALAMAYSDTGRHSTALRLLEETRRALPEWNP